MARTELNVSWGIFRVLHKKKEKRWASDGQKKKIFNIYGVFSLDLLMFEQSKTKLVLD